MEKFLHQVSNFHIGHYEGLCWCLCLPVERLHCSSLTVAVDVTWLGGVCQPGSFTAIDVGVGIQTLAHLVTDHVHQPLEHSLRSEHYVLLLLSRCYLSNQEKTKLENMFEPLLTLTLIFSLAEVSKN